MFGFVADRLRKLINGDVVLYRALLLSLTCLVSSAVNAIEYQLPTDGSNIVGTPNYYEVQKGDSLADIANKYNVGFLGMMAANKGIDPMAS